MVEEKETDDLHFVIIVFTTMNNNRQHLWATRLRDGRKTYLSTAVLQKKKKKKNFTSNSNFFELKAIEILWTEQTGEES